MYIEAKLEDLVLVLPEPLQVPQGLRLPFTWMRVRGNRAYISGHIALNPDGSGAQPLGKVGAEVSAEEGYQSARTGSPRAPGKPQTRPRGPRSAPGCASP